MFRVGLTGNVAAGKSAVVALWRDWGADVLDADQFAREAVEPGSPGLAAVALRFGTGVLRPDGTLDRAALRHRILADPADREALNAIVHPIVSRLAAEAEGQLARRGARLVVHDIPLLFESLDPSLYDAVVLIEAPIDIRRARMAERGLAPGETDALIAAQLPSEAKRGRSDFVIENGGTRDTLAAQARRVWNELQRRAGVA
jgi:dephospho-CoA kinase